MGVIFELIAADALTDLKGEYYNNHELKGAPALVRTDAIIDFNRGSGSPAKEINEDKFSVRWTGKITAPESGKYTFGWRSNGGARVFLDGKIVIEELQNPRTCNVIKEINLEVGKTYDLRVECFENANHYASSKLVWSPLTAQIKLRQGALEKAKQADTVIMVMGIRRRLRARKWTSTSKVSKAATALIFRCRSRIRN